MPPLLTRPVLDAIHADARAAFPNEACGFVIERAGTIEVVRVTNIQDQKHAENPEQFPRTAAIAYTMGQEAVPVLIGHDRGELVIRAIYHSHPQHAAYFSAEDKMQATVWDEPSYPDATQVVVSVIDGEVREAKAFRWQESARDFVEVPLDA
ncbi:MAG TPA: Mov34/MPN/PAD-1 family protein [Candidatus Dormibacteraeota bacterium]|nr:Mov34/MPN/PAD-1 family protein [Candidatus Dormibacteraeota bacterium]